LISALTHNPQPLHLDETYAEATEFGRIVVNGTFTFSLLVGLSVGDTTLGTLVANLGYDKVRMPKPVFIGDTLRAETGWWARNGSRPGRDRHLRHHVQ
jgi:acyl dehydratase